LSLQPTDGRTHELADRIGAGRLLASLLDALLDISKLDADAVRPEPSRFPVDALLSRLASELRPIALSKG
jgi:signal transduction histidine kinase